MSPLGVVMMGGVKQVVSLMLEVASVLKVGDVLVEPPSLQVVMDGCELFVLSVDFGDDGAPVCLELGASLVVALVALHLSGGREVKRMDHHSQGKEGGPCRLEEFLAPVRHGVEFPS
jgi:hypothetical protein